MDQFIIKRNGEYRPFEPFKIKDAIEKAFNSVLKNVIIESTKRHLAG